MDFREELLQRCKEKNMEPDQNGKYVTFFCARTPTDEDKRHILGPLPVDFIKDLVIEFKEGLKQSTDLRVRMAASKNSLMALTCEPEDKRKAVHCHGSFAPMMESNPEKVFEELSTIFMEDGWPDVWDIQIGDDSRTYNRKVIQELQTHKTSRAFSFTEDDVLNLKIQLGACASVDDFINSI